MKTKMRAIIALVTMLTITGVLFQNCSQDFSFQSITSDASVDRDDVDLGNGLTQVTDTFSLRVENQTQIDMVWVIDNSGSMTAESAHVRNNVLSFATEVNQQARLKMALVSDIGTSGNTTYLPQELIANGGLQIDQPVGSRNALMILGATLCSATAPMFPCADLVRGGMDAATYENNYRRIQGGLDTFFRTGAKKIFVFVTDDESIVPQENFMQFLRTQYLNQSPRIFGFVGLGAESPCQAREGVRYKEMATITAGGVYNICSEDWQPHFADLTKTVVAIANYQYELKTADIVEVISVKVNGVDLPNDAYKIENGVLTIDPNSAAALAGGTLQVIYTHNTPSATL